MNKFYLLLGSNMGNSRLQLETAGKHINKKLGKITRNSKLYQTAAWGKKDQPDFLNQVIVVESGIDAIKGLSIILAIEKVMGRIRTKKNAPRIIDIDILYFNKDIINLPELQIPHPAIQLRRFVLVPLNELSPNFIHPALLKTNHQLLNTCEDKLDVKKI
ncbi:MAG: 2-amino-4-hydroxy-6-hydroxymethyldihydropteridine diphosphokinase [Rhizobacter sp.]|nr:2-amino-4-hydroxy-6-hydroxymethyldihydropteridine diphosphokinase [Ferruginibacter sp.]